MLEQGKRQKTVKHRRQLNGGVEEAALLEELANLRKGEGTKGERLLYLLKDTVCLKLDQLVESHDWPPTRARVEGFAV